MIGVGSWHDLFWAYWFDLYVCVAYGVIFFRLFTRRFTKTEGVLLLLLAGHHFIEFIQLWVGDGFKIVMLPDRYFQAAAPLAWGWTAWGICQLWTWRKDRWKWLVRGCIAVMLLEVAGYESLCKLHHEYRKGTNRDGLVAGRKLAACLLADYRGPARYEAFPYTHTEYYTARRPVVKGDEGRALIAWVIRGQNALKLGPYPFPEDYFIRRVDAYFEELPEDLYEFMAEAKGTRRVWRLYRRKTVSGQDAPAGQHRPHSAALSPTPTLPLRPLPPSTSPTSAPVEGDHE